MWHQLLDTCEVLNSGQHILRHLGSDIADRRLHLLEQHCKVASNYTELANTLNLSLDTQQTFLSGRRMVIIAS